jgi:hypothetical protein
MDVMAKKQNISRHKAQSSAPAGYKTPLDEARDELFQHIMRCGVIDSAPEHQQEWFDATMTYFEGRYPELSKSQFTQLRTLGERFAKPLKAKQAV